MYNYIDSQFKCMHRLSHPLYLECLVSIALSEKLKLRCQNLHEVLASIHQVNQQLTNSTFQLSSHRCPVSTSMRMWLVVEVGRAVTTIAHFPP
jgi:hypothetical protein